MTTCNCEPKLKLRCENVSKTFIQKGNQKSPSSATSLDVCKRVSGHPRPGQYTLCRAGNARHRIRDA
ncbi:MAG: hypothetical protein ACLSAH_03825 [Bilophila wadsworthia]